MPDRPTETAATGRPEIDVEDLHRLVLKSLDDDQAVEVVSIPLAGKSNIADHMVIASGRSTRQVASHGDEACGPDQGASSAGSRGSRDFPPQTGF